MPITLAIDGMGGDQAPQAIIQGMVKAVTSFSHLRFELFGMSAAINPLLDQYPDLKNRTIFHPTAEVIFAETKPSAALRGFKESSMRKAIESVREKRTQGVVSAGNTGAYMALSRLLLGVLPGIDRPAIGGLMPTLKGPKIMLDMGANVEVSAENLIEFSIMGVAFARVVLGIANPSVGLLNIGTEELKGNAILKFAHQRLKESNIFENFTGFVEGDSLAQGNVDVTVADGFAGNICLKTAEGTAKLMSHFLKEGIEKSFLSKLGVLLAKPAFNHLRKKIDPRQYNGAPFLGLKEVAVKSHGGTDAEGFLQAIRVALTMIEKNINYDISQEISAFSILSKSEMNQNLTMPLSPLTKEVS